MKCIVGRLIIHEIAVSKLVLSDPIGGWPWYWPSFLWLLAFAHCLCTMRQTYSKKLRSPEKWQWELILLVINTSVQTPMNFFNVCGLLCKCSSWSTFVIKMCVAIRRWSKKSVEYFTSLSFQHLATVPVSQGFIVGMLSDHILSDWRYKRVAFKPKNNRCLLLTIFHSSERSTLQSY